MNLLRKPECSTNYENDKSMSNRNPPEGVCWLGWDLPFLLFPKLRWSAVFVMPANIYGEMLNLNRCTVTLSIVISQLRQNYHQLNKSPGHKGDVEECDLGHMLSEPQQRVRLNVLVDTNMRTFSQYYDWCDVEILIISSIKYTIIPGRQKSKLTFCAWTLSRNEYFIDN